MLKHFNNALFIGFSLFALQTNAQEIGNFISVVPAPQDASFHLPATHKFQVLAQSGTAIPNGTGNVPTMLYFCRVFTGK